MDPEPSQVTEEAEVRKKPSLLSDMLVSGLLKNINEKVTNKLDQEAQSELAGIVKGAAEAIGLRSLAADLGYEVPISLYADSSAAIGICQAPWPGEGQAAGS